MRYLKYLFLIVVAICLCIAALANRQLVTLKVLPAEMSSYLGQPYSYELPMFMVIFGAIIVGLLIGFVWEWFREHKIRVQARSATREKKQLERQVRGLREHSKDTRDDVLALLDNGSKA